jgi:hypothetical protein
MEWRNVGPVIHSLFWTCTQDVGALIGMLSHAWVTFVAHPSCTPAAVQHAVMMIGFLDFPQTLNENAE